MHTRSARSWPCHHNKQQISFEFLYLSYWLIPGHSQLHSATAFDEVAKWIRCGESGPVSCEWSLWVYICVIDTHTPTAVFYCYITGHPWTWWCQATIIWVCSWVPWVSSSERAQWRRLLLSAPLSVGASAAVTCMARGDLGDRPEDALPKGLLHSRGQYWVYSPEGQAQLFWEADMWSPWHRLIG